MRGRTEYTIKNLNREKIFKEIAEITDIKNVKSCDNLIKFSIKNNKQKNVDKILDKKGADVLNKKKTGVLNFLKNTIFRVGILTAIIIFLIFVYICNFFIFRHEIIGLNLISKTEIESVLNECNVQKVMPKNNINVKEIQNKIQAMDKVSLVSVIIRGNTLVINIKEKVYNSEYEDKDNFMPIVSEYNGVITELNIIQGTPLVRVGQTIKVGQELVSPYIIDTSGQTLMVKPMADIKADVFYNTLTSISQNKVEYVDTVNNYIVREMFVFGKSIFTSNVSCNYKHYRCETKCETIGLGSIFQIEYKKTKYIEQTEVIKENYFTDNKQMILQECKQKTRQLFPSYEIIKEEYNTITENAGIVLISYTMVVNKTI